MMHPDAPIPDLRIVPTTAIHPHEEADSQRLRPLVEKIRQEAYFINPPIVTPMGGDEYVVLDGANRCNAFLELGYEHILVQVVQYDSGLVELENWQHVICHWDVDDCIRHLSALPEIQISDGQNAHAIAHLLLRDGGVKALLAPVRTTHERNEALRHVVAVYQRHAVLQRTALTEPDDIFPLHPDGIAIVVFPPYQPSDIIAAARQRAYLPPGISRHIVQGRALLVNYPLSALHDPTHDLAQKNAALHDWIVQKIAQRSIRYYAESTYQFDE